MSTSPIYDLGGGKDDGFVEESEPHVLVPVAIHSSPEYEEEKGSKQRTTSTFFSDEYGNLKFVNLVCRYPCAVFVTMVIICLGSAMILISLARATGNPFTEDENAYDIHDVRSIAYDSLKLAKEVVADAYDVYTDSIQESAVEAEPNAKLQEDSADVTFWIYEAKTEDGLFTKEAIPVLRATEATILDNEEYPNYCKLDYIEMNGQELSQCAKPLTAMNIFYASSWNASLADELLAELTDENVNLYNTLAACVEFKILCDVLPAEILTAENILWVNTTSEKIDSMVNQWDGNGTLNGDIDQVNLFMATMNKLQTKARHVNFFFDENFNTSNPVVMYSRSTMFWGQLLNGTTNEEESGDKLKEFIMENLFSNWTEITAKDHNPEVQTFYFMGTLIFDVILKILAVDGAKAFASFVAVFFYLRLMLGSWFLTAVGMFEIFLSVPLSWLFFSYIFQIKYFSTLNVLSIFIVIAIGADDIFVFMDAYNQSASKGPEILSSLESRMSYVYRRSGSAMLLTSATTCSAFLCTLASPIAGTRSFGIFAAFVILFDYILVMTLFCTSVVIYHNRFESKRFCCNCTFWKVNSPTPTEHALNSYHIGVEPKPDRISKFFKVRCDSYAILHELHVKNMVPLNEYCRLINKGEACALHPQWTEQNHYWYCFDWLDGCGFNLYLETRTDQVN